MALVLRVHLGDGRSAADQCLLTEVVNVSVFNFFDFDLSPSRVQTRQPSKGLVVVEPENKSVFGILEELLHLGLF